MNNNIFTISKNANVNYLATIFGSLCHIELLK